MATEKKRRAREHRRARAEALEAKLATLTILVPPAVRVPGLKIADNGVEVPEADFGKAAPSDPGPHAVVASAPGHRSREFKVTVPATKGEASVTVEALTQGEPEPPPSAVSANEPDTGPADAPRTSSPEIDTKRGNTQRWIGIGVGAAGVIATGVGLAFGLSAKSSLDASNESGRCDAQNLCTDEGLARRDDASSAATLSTVFVGVGVAALVGGVVLYLTAPKSTSAQRAGGGGVAFVPAPRGFALRF